MAGPANARLSSISRGMSSWVGSMYGRLRLRSRQLKPTSTGLKMSVHSRKYRLTAEDMRMGICPPEKGRQRKRSDGFCGQQNNRGGTLATASSVTTSEKQWKGFLDSLDPDQLPDQVLCCQPVDSLILGTSASHWLLLTRSS